MICAASRVFEKNVYVERKTKQEDFKLNTFELYDRISFQR